MILLSIADLHYILEVWFQSSWVFDYRVWVIFLSSRVLDKNVGTLIVLEKR